MDRRNYLLKIDKHCGQDWNSMTRTDIGKFCHHCSKAVVDFTQLTDNEVLQIIEQNSGKLCGRLSQNQLNRVIQPYQPTKRTRLYKILAGLLFIGTSENIFASPIQELPQNIVSIVDNKNTNSQPTERKPEPTTDSLKNVVQGLVIDSKTKEPLQLASIFIKDTKTGTITDNDGKFELIIPDSLVSDKIYLVIACLGYQTTEIIINKNDLPTTKHFAIVPAEQALLGEVIVVKKKKWWQRKK